MKPELVSITEQVNGDTFSGKEFRLKYTVSGLPVSLVGATIRGYWRKDSVTGNIVKRVEIGDGYTVTDASGGIYQLDSFKPEWKRGIYYNHTEITFSDASVKTWTLLKLELLQDGTN